jgi:hypothetical protein
MALQYVGGKTQAIEGTTSDAVVSLTDLTGGLASQPAADDIVIVGYVIYALGDVAVGVQTAGYTEIAELRGNDVSDANLSVSYKIMGGTPDTSVTVSPTLNTAFAGAVVIHVWRGVDTTTPLDVASTTAVGTNTDRPNPPAITPSTAGAVVVAIGGGSVENPPGAVLTQPGSELSNFLSIKSDDVEGAVIAAGSYAWTSGAFDPVAWTGGNNHADSSWAAVTLALRPGVTSIEYTKSLSASTTPIHSLAKSTTKTQRVNGSATAAIARASTKAFQASSAAASTVQKAASKMLASVADAVAALVAGIAFSKSVSGEAGAAPTLGRLPDKQLAVSASGEPGLVRLVARALASNAATVASIGKEFPRSVVAVVSAVGSLAKALPRVLSASTVGSAILARATSLALRGSAAASAVLQAIRVTLAITPSDRTAIISEGESVAAITELSKAATLVEATNVATIVE